MSELALVGGFFGDVSGLLDWACVRDCGRACPRRSYPDVAAVWDMGRHSTWKHADSRVVPEFDIQTSHFKNTFPICRLICWNFIAICVFL